MTALLARMSAKDHCYFLLTYKRCFGFRAKSTSTKEDPRFGGDVGRTIEDEYAHIRDNYQTPKNPIVLAHGLMGFDELHLAGSLFPGIHYWRGITEALTANGIEVIIASVPATASIEDRAAKLGVDISKKAGGKKVNIIAHSMVRREIHISLDFNLFTFRGTIRKYAEHSQFHRLIGTIRGLDSRYMVSCLRPPNVDVLSLTTVASPHRGSAFADHCFERIGVERVPKIYKALEFLRMQSGAFSQLTRRYMRETFNPKTPDVEGIRYFSYGATVQPSLWSSFRLSHRIIEEEEGANDGLVSVDSSKWGIYKGTLVGVSHLDLINWTNRLRWLAWELTGNKRNFNAIAFYLDIADMLAKECL
ncbi:MAG: hypothetical protein M1827_001374 [Pycnora praestabilis]|nr:MAG: hypothetical protein M1827_001374 [Pycnora praestabilis]